MKEYTIIPEFRYSKSFPYAAIFCQIVAIGFVIFGCALTLAGFIFPFLFQFCAVYYMGLFLCNRYYRITITPGVMTVWSIFNRSKKCQAETLRWKVCRIPWFNDYYILLYSSGRMPIALIKPHWMEKRAETLAVPSFRSIEGPRAEISSFFEKCRFTGAGHNRSVLPASVNRDRNFHIDKIKTGVYNINSKSNVLT